VIESLTGQGINLQHACRALSVSPSGYYAWKDRPDPPRTLRRIWLAGEIADIHKISGGTLARTVSLPSSDMAEGSWSGTTPSATS
jgi:hypothetical protein